MIIHIYIYIFIWSYVHVHMHSQLANTCRLRGKREGSYPWLSWSRHACTGAIWLMEMCDMTRGHVWHDSIVCVTWHIHSSICSFMSRHACTGAIWLMDVCNMTESYVWHDTFAHSYAVFMVSTRLYRCDMTRSYVWHDSFICAISDICIRLVHMYMCVERAHVWSVTTSILQHRRQRWNRQSGRRCCSCLGLHTLVPVALMFMCVYIYIHARMHTCDMTHSYVRHDSFVSAVVVVSMHRCWLYWCMHVSTCIHKCIHTCTHTCISESHVHIQ